MDSNDDDFEIDPAIAAAMGFSGFGTAPNKKRKYNNDGFVDPSIAKGPQGTSANNLPIGERKVTKAVEGVASSSAAAAAPETQGVPIRSEPSHQQAQASAAHETGPDGRPTLQALRNGVRNERGDLAIFLPSFIEDPWAGLKAQ